jgi:hypothetical protein
MFGTPLNFHQIRSSPLWRIWTYACCNHVITTKDIPYSSYALLIHCSEDCLLERFHLQLSLHHA